MSALIRSVKREVVGKRVTRGFLPWCTEEVEDHQLTVGATRTFAVPTNASPETFQAHLEKNLAKLAEEVFGEFIHPLEELQGLIALGDQTRSLNKINEILKAMRATS